ncbi:MAG: hypothetical protein PHO02_02685 [Candidatus Nanoarchaeia archaeon]|nr:hypothetical protein [Candidatus Nanoarchaeia archaeon]
MFHPGKVTGIFSPKDKEVHSADDSTQALVEMWDENLFTCMVDPKIAAKLKEGDVVLVDYRPVSEKSTVPKQIISKIVYKKKASMLWEQYAEYKRQRKQETSKQQQKTYMG